MTEASPHTAVPGLIRNLYSGTPRTAVPGLTRDLHGATQEGPDHARAAEKPTRPEALR
jgi:hypothetical protein